MKKTYLMLLTAIAVMITSCVSGEDNPGIGEGEREIEINIATSSLPATRAHTLDDGFDREREIKELDLLVFSSSDVYLYRREAYRVGATSSYKTTMVETNDMLKAYVFANSRSMIETWEARVDRATDWEGTQAQLLDANPSRLVGTNIDTDYTPLPMWGVASGTVSTTQVNKWGTVQLLRSVASVDAYVVKATAPKLTLTDLHLYYAPNNGYLAPVPNTGNANGYVLAAPSTMTTTLNTLVASDCRTMYFEENSLTVAKYAIEGQMYLYDNDVVPPTTATKRYTRAIIAGYYDQPNPVYVPEEPGVDQRKKRYWPLDFVESDGSFRQIKRNWKYAFNVKACNGPGYGSLEEAAENFPIDLNVEVIQWNRDEMEIGVAGEYYVSMERKEAYLQRIAGSKDHLKLTYNIIDHIPGESFTIKFKDASNGTEETITNGIKNDYFKVTLVHDVSGKRADLYFEALQNYTQGHSTDTVVITFRTLQFEVGITQLDSADVDWGDGGEIPGDL